MTNYCYTVGGCTIYFTTMTECPPEFFECLTEEEYDEIIDLFVENDIAMPESMGDDKEWHSNLAERLRLFYSYHQSNYSILESQ